MPTLEPQTISFTVYGKPQPAGSKRAFAMRDKTGKPLMRANGTQVVSVVDDNPKSRDWKTEVKYAAMDAYRGPVLEGPLSMRLVFNVARPVGHFGSGKNFGQLKASAPKYPTVKPDVLKLARGVEDALTGIIYRDDSLIVDEVLIKRYADRPSVEVTITRAE